MFSYAPSFLSLCRTIGSLSLGAAIFVAGTAAADYPTANVMASDGEIFPHESRTLDSYDGYSVNPENLELSHFGGWKARQVEATGFFRVEKIDGRWWAIDPEGYLFIAKSVNSVSLDSLNANEIYDLLFENGFNGTGRWSDRDLIVPALQDEQPLIYHPTFSFLGEYDKPGSSADLYFPVFDDEFQAHVDAYAADTIPPFADDPAVFGYMSDNELSWYGNLEEHLELNDQSNKNHTTAVAFLEERGKNANNWDEEDEDAYVGLMADAFYSAVASAIDKVDPNHMYLGSRANSGERYNQAFMEAAGRHVDVFSMNHYSRWGAYDVNINLMEEWLNKPMILTEWYAQQVEINSTATGAGYRVADQESRGLFFQNYVTTHLDNKNVVGFHWFKFQDDGNGNKGIVDEDGNPYNEVLGYMKEMHENMYDFIDYLDSRSPPDVVLGADADAFYDGDTNLGDAEDLRIEHNSGSYGSRTFIRFDVSELQTDISDATIELKSFRTTGGTGRYQAELVEDDSWDEMSVNRSNNPPASTLLYEWSHGSDVSIDVTDVLRDAVTSDGMLSIRLSSEQNTFRTPYYGSRENDNSDAHPQLLVDYEDDSSPEIPEEPDVPEVLPEVPEEPEVPEVPEEPEVPEVPETSAEVTIFDFSSFNSAEDFATFGVGVFNDMGRWDNDISSIEIPDGMQVTACEDAAGTIGCVTFTESVSEMPGTLHNAISFLAVETTAGSAEPEEPAEPEILGEVTIYDFTSFNSSEDFVMLGVGEYSDMGRWDDDISSIQIPDGFQVTACEDSAGTIGCVTFTESVSDMQGTLHNEISYLLVESAL